MYFERERKYFLKARHQVTACETIYFKAAASVLPKKKNVYLVICNNLFENTLIYDNVSVRFFVNK